MNTELLPGESVTKDGAANLQCGIESVGGKLYLTDRRLVFESHSMNVQTGVTEIPLADITATALCWTKFLNLIPMVPNSLAVTTRQGQQHRFVLFGRDVWKKAIDWQCANPPSNAAEPSAGAEPSSDAG